MDVWKIHKICIEIDVYIFIGQLDYEGHNMPFIGAMSKVTKCVMVVAQGSKTYK